MSSHQEKASSGDVFDLYWRGCRLESQLTHQLSPLWFSSVPLTQVNSGHDCFLHRSFESILHYNRVIWHYIILASDSVIQHTMTTRVLCFGNDISHCDQTLQEKQGQNLCFPAFSTVSHFVGVNYYIQHHAQCLLSFSSVFLLANCLSHASCVSENLLHIFHVYPLIHQITELKSENWSYKIISQWLYNKISFLSVCICLRHALHIIK